MTLDYRMGPQWGRPQLLALFELLRQLVAGTGGDVRYGRSVGTTEWHMGRLFVREWEAYCLVRGGSAAGDSC